MVNVGKYTSPMDPMGLLNTTLETESLQRHTKTLLIQRKSLMLIKDTPPGTLNSEFTPEK